MRRTRLPDVAHRFLLVMRKAVALVWWWRGSHIKGVAGQLRLGPIAWGGGEEAPSEGSPDFGRPVVVVPMGVDLLLGGAFVEPSSTFLASEQATRVKA
jgi:hypothetical protein